MTDELERAKQWIDDADAIFFTSGAGLTAAAGINYADTEFFAQHFPGMLQYGVTAQYQMIGADVPDEQIFWGYWASHVKLVRHTPPPNPEPYELLRTLADRFDESDTFVMTSNVDALFARNGFPAGRVHTPQGDYALMQCAAPGSRGVWEWRDELEAIVAATDPETQRCTDPSLIPRCPGDGGRVFMNVRADSTFIDDHWEPTARAMESFLGSQATNKLVVLEVGAGFNTPSVIRWPGERIVEAVEPWRLVRLNMTEPEVPLSIADRAVGIGGDALAALRTLIG